MRNALNKSLQPPSPKIAAAATTIGKFATDHFSVPTESLWIRTGDLDPTFIPPLARGVGRGGGGQSKSRIRLGSAAITPLMKKAALFTVFHTAIRLVRMCQERFELWLLSFFKMPINHLWSLKSTSSESSAI